MLSENPTCVRLLEQHSSQRCILGETFGCIPDASKMSISSKMWVHGCRGRFACANSGVSFLCGYPPGPQKFECSCDGHDKGGEAEFIPTTRTRRHDREATSCDEAGFDAVEQLRTDLRATGLVSNRPLVLCAGEGTTATRSIADALRGLGLRTLHFDDTPVISTLLTADPALYSEIDFPRLLAGFDAVSDMPIPQFFPFLLAAFPNARVLHSVRDPLEWVIKRSTMLGLGVGAAKPFASLYASLSAVPTMNFWLHKRGNTTQKQHVLGMKVHTRRSARYADALLYSAEAAYYRCITPAAQYMLVRPFEGDLCNKTFVPRLARFVGAKVPTRPHFTVSGCK